MGQVILKDQWPHVLSEMYRVLKPGGVIELVEADLWHHNPGPVQKAFDEFSQTQCNEVGLDFRFTETLSEQLDTIGFKVSVIHSKQNIKKRTERSPNFFFSGPLSLSPFLSKYTVTKVVNIELIMLTPNPCT